MNMANYASCDADHIYHLLKMVVTGLRRLRGQHPWLLRGLDEQYSWLDGIQAAPAPPAAAGAVLASEPAKGVWQMLGPGYWLIVASINRGIRAAYTKELLSWGASSSSSSSGGRSSDGDCTWLCRTALSVVLQSDSVFRMALDIRAIPPAVHVALGRAAALSCVMIQEAMDAQLTVDGTVLIGAAERCCESALDQWCLCLSYRPAWRVQRAWVLPAMALSAIGESERPAALRVLRWVFNAASAEGSVVAGAAAGEMQLPPLLLTLLAFKCARYGHYDTFRWLYARGRALTAQDITPQVCIADFKAFMEQVMVPSHAAARNDKMLFLMKPEPAAPHTYSLMDNAICYGQEAFVRALSASDVPSLSSFTHDSAALAAANTSCRLLQWLHAHPACPFNAVNVIKASLQSCSGGTLGVSAGDDAIERIALEKLRWLHSVDAFEVLSQRGLNNLVAFTGTKFAMLPQSAHPVLRARILWLLDDMGAQWPGGGAASIVRAHERVNACAVVRMVSDLECPWGQWTSEECALVRSRQQQQQRSEGLAGAQRWMQQLHALGCPCACAEAGNA
ncbi:hypothetical protein JKP88DRAFT_350893 [Tribonema minus]|uniref:Uncharacterized protein n=1 Tax=Tribonema minus TaxID=303371 RepID=A0A836C8W5_9STRA|nr:hypothetical protein JKP88DRAFT_350893 [Tribonema minus]